MGLLEEIFARSQMQANPALYHQNPPELESILETLARGPEETTRRVKNPFPAVVAPPAPVVAPIQQMAQQAGILAPGAGRLGAVPTLEEAPPAPPAIDGPVPMPAPRPPIDANASIEPGDVPVQHGGGGRPTSLITPAQREALHEAAPTLAPAPTTAMPSRSPFGGSSLLDRLTSGLGNHSNTLLALAAGFAGAPTIGQGISRAAAAAIPARAADIREQLLNRGTTTTTAALLRAGVPMQLAVAAQANPTLMKAVTEKYLTGRKAELKEIHSEDAFGNKSTRLVAVDPYDLTTKDITGGGGGAGTSTEGTAGPTLYAPGVSQVDSTKVGDEYLAQFSPEVQAGVKNYINGNSLPTGRQKLAQTIKTIAQKYGEDVGVPVNDQLYGARKEFQTSLGNTKNGVGAQVKGFQQGLEHAVELSDNLVKLGNSSGLGFEDVATGVNWVKNRTVAAQDIVRHIQNSSQALAGEVGKLYSGGTGGGVHERDATKKLLGDPNMSGPAAAGALESTIELMEGGLRTLERRRDELFPHGRPAGGEFRSKAEEAAIEHIKKNIAILRGEQAREAEAKPAARPKLKPGESTRIGDVTIRRVD